MDVGKVKIHLYIYIYVCASVGMFEVNYFFTYLCRNSLLGGPREPCRDDGERRRARRSRGRARLVRHAVAGGAAAPGFRETAVQQAYPRHPGRVHLGSGEVEVDVGVGVVVGGSIEMGWIVLAKTVCACI